MGDYYLLNHRVVFAIDEAVQRTSEDAAWLASVFPKELIGHVNVLDIGAGTGAVGLCARYFSAGNFQLTFLEKDLQAISLLYKNLQKNEVKADVLNADVLNAKIQEKYDVVLTNPPYYLEESGHKSDKQTKQKAHYISKENIVAWVQKALDFTKEEGVCAVILHKDSFVQCAPLFTGFEHDVVELQTSGKKPAKKVIVRAFKHVGAQNNYIVNAYDEKVRESVLKNAEPLDKWFIKKGA